LTTHDEFRALCALSTSGCLSEEESSRLEEHVLTCLDCRKIVQEYETIARTMPSLISDFPAVLPGPFEGWSEERAKQELFRKLAAREQSDMTPAHRYRSGRGSHAGHEAARAKRKSTPWLDRMVPYAAAIAMVALIGLLGFHLGINWRTNSVPVTQQGPAREVDRAHDEVAAMSQERQLLRAQLEERNRGIASLGSKIARQSAELQNLKKRDQEGKDSLQRIQEEKIQTASERDGLSHKLEQAQSNLALMQKDIESLRQLRANDAFRVTELEARIGKLPDLLKDRDATIEGQRELLDRDRDIRDLMGARDLYIAEVFDVGRDGETKKPFGRVFYTKGKSLIFYAYDLDQQPGLREASTFQAWGRRGPDMAQAMNLGIFYMDNTTHKQWVLKFDDPKSLEQIDAVFVTVEPKGGSRKPSGKQLLFAYLRVEPNHP